MSATQRAATVCHGKRKQGDNRTGGNFSAADRQANLQRPHKIDGEQKANHRQGQGPMDKPCRNAERQGSFPR
jgi:hypothetical protein